LRNALSTRSLVEQIALREINSGKVLKKEAGNRETQDVDRGRKPTQDFEAPLRLD
jgi:hypothetical protein